MHNKDHYQSWQHREQSNQSSVSRRSGIPGKRTLTASLPPRTASAPRPPLQRQRDPAAEALQRKRAAETEAWMNVVMRPDLYEAPVQYAANGEAPSGQELPSDGVGKAMPAAVQAKMESAFEADFSAVRIHQGPRSAALGARAYTQGTQVHFAPGEYQPDSRSGQELLGHELTHVVQQSQGRVSATSQAKGVAVNDDAGLEREADESGAQAARGERVSVAVPDNLHSLAPLSGRPEIQRQEVPNEGAQQNPEATTQEEVEFTDKNANEGLGRVGKFLDRAIPSAGDQIALTVSLKIPIPNSPAYVSVDLSLKAARGIDGAMTAGVPKQGDPNRLEVMGSFSIGAGVSLVAADIGGSVSIFARAGANTTAAAMRAFSYGVFRTANSMSRKLGGLWVEGEKQRKPEKNDKEKSRNLANEEWAFGEENDVLRDENANAFVHVGGGISGGATGSVGVASISGAAGASVFRAWDKKSLEAYDGKYAANRDQNEASHPAPVPGNRQEAKAKRKQGTGQTRGSIGVSFGTKVSVPVLGSVALSASLSGPTGALSSKEKLKKIPKTFMENCGVEVSASLSLPAGTTFGKIAAGLIPGIHRVVAGAAQMVGKTVAPKDVEAGNADAITGALLVSDGELKQAISNALSKAGVGLDSSITLAIILGLDGGSPILRVEVRDDVSLGADLTFGNVGINVSATKSKRLAAVGYDDGKGRGELLGNRENSSRKPKESQDKD